MEEWIIPKEIEGSEPRGISRREALRRVGGGLAGLWLASLGIEPGRRAAEAATTDVDWAARHGLTAAEYQAEFARLAGQGYRLVDVSGYEAGGQARYAGIWERSGGPPWQARHGLTAAQYQAEFDALVRQGYRPVHLCGYTVGGQDTYAGIWEQSSGVAWEARHRLTSAQYQALFNSLTGQGYRPVCVSGYEVGGQETYAAIFEKSGGPAWEARHGLTGDQYQAAFDQLAARGFRLARVNGYPIAGQARYAAIWVQSSGPAWQARHGLPGAQYQGEFDELRYQGYRPLRVSGYGISGQEYYAGIWENRAFAAGELGAMETDFLRFMRQYDVPGASIAIAKDGRLVYARGFGIADGVTGEKVTTRHLFRIASVSKPITSAALFTLVQQGRLRLSDRVFGAGGVLGTSYGRTPYGTNIERITVGHLLQHTGGGWSNDSQDPMFSHPAMNQAQLITWVLDNRPLDTVPGTSYAYSNFGYSVLGRIIERVTGEAYDGYVRRAVLAPSGIGDMAIAGNTLADRRPNEVRYVGQSGEDPYGMQVTRMDSHGGWLATAIDLVRFAVRVDGYATKPDLLSAASITEMTTPSLAGSGYAKGWQVNSAGNWWHTGSLPGTGSILVRTRSGFCWAALLNTRSLDSAFFGALDDTMWEVVREVSDWPAYDLF